jgi:hypothetical protein
MILTDRFSASRVRLPRFGIGLAQVRTPARDGLLDGFDKAVLQVPAVGDLHRRGRPGEMPSAWPPARSPAHDLDSRMGAQPAGEGVGVPIGQQIDRPAGVHAFFVARDTRTKGQDSVITRDPGDLKREVDTPPKFPAGGARPSGITEFVPDPGNSP